MLSEKLRPKTFNQVIGNKEIVKILKNLIAEGDVPNLLFYGTPGTGKTTMAYIVSREILKTNFRNNFLEMNASVDRGIEVVRGRIKDFASTAPISSEYRILLLDEACSLTNDAQQALRRTMESYRSCKFILTANEFQKIIDPIKSRCLCLPFKSISEADLREALKFTNLSFSSDESRELLIKYSKRDLRFFFNNIQGLTSLSKTITIDDVRTVIGIPDEEQINNLLKPGKEFKEIRDSIFKMIESGANPKSIISYLLTKITSQEELKKLSDTDYRISVGGMPELHLLNYFITIKKINPTKEKTKKEKIRRRRFGL